MDADAVYYHFSLHNFYWTPETWLSLEGREKALVIASIKVEMARRKKEQDKIKK
ncbi:hypothetical protein GGGNBK_18395 [Sporosarcina sp. ANT_H38]|uniref:hypothetical protein n=1 Tax=Sporosarcina sp. ANT_H38 TaxID=2597358 RepID=UPI00165DB2BC|nr:hypothetical protein [Sporosarcina sp. ANT_H38]